MGVLEDILKTKRAEIPALRKQKLPAEPSFRPAFDLKRHDAEPLRLICEIKKRSPSAGVLSTVLSVADRARAYEQGGASALSVLCDRTYFDGGYSDLSEARSGCSLPLLCKEFILDECQLDAALAYGASAVLLIVRCLTDEELSRLIDGCEKRFLTPLVEVYTQEEASRALAAGARCIGVNARDLDSLTMDQIRAAEILAKLPATVTRIHLSGVRGPEDIQQLRTGPSDGALVGELLMREDAPLSTLLSLHQAAHA